MCHNSVFDQEKGGRSTISVDTNQTVTYSYVRRKVNDSYPYAGITIQKKDGSYFEAANHTLHIEADLTGSNTINVRLEVFAPNFTNGDDLNSFVFCQKIISGKNGHLDFEIELSDLEVPSWWVKNRKLTTEEIPSFDFDQTTSIVLDHDPSIGMNKMASVELKSLAFIPNRFVFYAINVVIVSFTILWLLYIRLKEQSKIIIAAPYKIKNQVDDEPIDKKKLLINYLAENYANGQLTQSKISYAIGISPAEISKIIKTEFDLTYNQYINFLKIEEAKRLLINTDLQIKEIVIDTGYENTQHFSRVFKNATSLTPSEFRKSKGVTNSNI